MGRVYRCFHPKVVKHKLTYRADELIPADPEEMNKNNDCKYYRMEWHFPLCQHFIFAFL